MYIVKIMYITKGWKVHKDKTPPVSREAAEEIAELQTQYLLKMMELKIIDDYMVEIIAE